MPKDGNFYDYRQFEGNSRVWMMTRLNGLASSVVVYNTNTIQYIIQCKRLDYLQKMDKVKANKTASFVQIKIGIIVL